jgi:two-component system alkaline phosphatase synthesis response regulator PhoP
MIWIITHHKGDYSGLMDKLNLLGHPPRLFTVAAEALKELEVNKPEAIFLDVDDAELTGLEFCWILKSSSEWKKIKVFIISSKTDDATEIKAFENGADEFLLKPLREQVAIKRVIRQLRINGDYPTLNFSVNGHASLRIDKESYTVFFNNEPVLLSKKEFELLFLLASQPGKVFTREEIFNKIWKKSFGKKDRTIDVHILRLRKKLGEDFFSTQKGIGYRFYA